MIEDEMLKRVDEIVRMRRPPKYKTAVELWEKFMEYVEMVNRNPWRSVTKAKKQKQETPLSVKKEDNCKRSGNEQKEAMEGERLIRRPYTKQGWQLYAGISNWEQYKKEHAHKKEFVIIIRAIDTFIEDNQITGAVIGEFNERIVSRLNALEDIQVVRGDRFDSMTREELLEEAERLRKTREE